MKSSGSAAEKWPNLMGKYKLDNTRTAQLKKVYKKTDGEHYIYYNRKFYYDDNVVVKKLSF